ncbi:tyrosine-type recombinase/integrase [Pseudoalteromonas luteoviolacea]|uniref:tyrosine-type recombinase/integrase n=1 Tax=Pseudoalteromonas luteoviolacea TaxID=43657 RepID=UPI001EEE6704|nr:tyrosine-type recombinase/integrase [Pseudoalteromonas luteoviolacea]MCF6439730.1 tyrosine-type recombinase/integrase [Pseudoalteromonas luteoviolacea]
MHKSITVFEQSILESYGERRLADGYSVNTVEKQSNNLQFFLIWLHTQTQQCLTGVNQKHFDQYKVYLCRYVSPKTHAKLNPTTCRKRATDVRTFYKELMFMGILKSNPLQNAKSPKAPKPVVRALLTQEQVEWLMSQTVDFGMYGLRDRAILECYYGVAARRMELAELTLKDIQLEGEKCFVLVEKGKGGKGRYIPLYPRTAFWLSQYLKHVRPKLASLCSSLHVFLDSRGKKFNGAQLSRLVRKYLLMAGLDVGAACNALRHSAATHLMEHGANVRDIQEYLGHSDISTTQVYLTVTQLQLRKTLSRCHPAALSEAPKGLAVKGYLN